jgi:hypothetical protein
LVCLTGTYAGTGYTLPRNGRAGYTHDFPSPSFLIPISFHETPLYLTHNANPIPVLHQYFLSLFGLNIGELWDLKALSETCKKLGRYEFFFTSIPLNVPGGIGSPPNALALF